MERLGGLISGFRLTPKAQGSGQSDIYSASLTFSSKIRSESSDICFSRPRYKLWSLKTIFPPKAVAKLRKQQAKFNGLIEFYMDNPLLMDCLKTRLSEEEKKERLINLLKKSSQPVNS